MVECSIEMKELLKPFFVDCSFQAQCMEAKLDQARVWSEVCGRTFQESKTFFVATL